MTLHDRTKIIQKPITESMSPEHLKQYKQEVREAQYGNPPFGFDIADAWRGRNFCQEPKTMSDYLTYPVKQPESQEVYTMAYTPREKAEMIQRWTFSIEKLKNQIAKLQADKTLSVAERKKKINRRQDIINDYMFSIKQAQEYIDREHKKIQQIIDSSKAKTK